MGEAWLGALLWLAGAVCVLAALTLLRRPLSAFFRLLGRTGVGLALLALFAPVGQLLGAGLGINLFNALVIGVLGAPGFGLLLMLKWALR